VNAIGLKGTVIYWQHVVDVERVYNWFMDALGLIPDTHPDNPLVRMLTIPGQSGVKVGVVNSGFENPKDRSLLDLQVGNVEGTYHTLRNKSDIEVSELDNPAGNYYEFTLKDPEGNPIRIHGFKTIEDYEKPEERNHD